MFQIGLAYPLLLSALRRVSALEASLLLFIEPVLSPLWAWLLHGERPGAWAVAGGALILAATAIRTAAERDEFTSARGAGSQGGAAQHPPAH